MKTLYLLRHAKASWKGAGKDADVEDQDRPLKKKGREQADRLSDHLSSLLPPPQGVWCSPAKRTRQTLEYFLEVWPLDSGSVHFDPALYLASSGRLLKQVRAFPDSMDVVLLVGHNPGITDVLHALDQTATEAVSHLRTCEFVQLDFQVDRWEDVEKGCGSLKLCIRAKDLPS
jgi:phosphohistidine phosphatase